MNETAIFINPPGPTKLYRSMVCTFISKANYIWQPQDFINLSAHFPENFNLKLIDCSINNLNTEHLYNEIIKLKPSLCIIAISSIVFDNDLNFLKNFKSSFPDIRCLVIGDVLLEKAFHEKVLEYADGLILNPFDIDLKNYIKNNTTNSENLILKNSMQNKKTSTTEIKPKKLSTGIPRHEIFISKNYRFPFVKSYCYTTVSTQFGCPFKCSYCSWSKIPVAYRDYKEILEETEKIDSLGIKDIFFADPSFGFPKENSIPLLEEMISKKYNLRWCCYGNPLLLNKEFLILMKKAGCHTIITGIENGSPDTINSKFKRELSESKLTEFCRQCQILDIQICGDFIIGLNDCNEKTINDMVNLAKKLKIDYASFNLYTILLGSELRENLVKNGEIQETYISGLDTSGKYGKRNAQLKYLKNMAIRKFYLRPSYLFRRMSKIRSLTEFMIQLKEMKELFKNE